MTGLNHILFGSDFPFTPTAGINENVKAFRNPAGLSQTAHEAIARDNVLTFSQIQRRRGKDIAPLEKSRTNSAA